MQAWRGNRAFEANVSCMQQTRIKIPGTSFHFVHTFKHLFQRQMKRENREMQAYKLIFVD